MSVDPLAPDFANTPVSRQRPDYQYEPRARATAPAVTIITPFYNTGSIFLETAESVLGQSLQQWEWLIINDGTDDPEALQMLGKFRDKDPRIHVIDMNANQGPPSARNAGLRSATGDFVFFLDSDDLIEPTTLEKTTWFLESNPQFGFCKGYTVSFDGQEYLGTVGFQTADLFLSRNPVTILSMVKRQVLEAVGGFDETLMDGLEDWDFWLHCAAEGFWGYTIPEYLDWYRRRPDHSDRWQDWTEVGLQTMRERLEKRYPGLYAEGIPRVARRRPKPFEDVPETLPYENPLKKERTRLLLIIPWMAMGGADKFNLDLARQLTMRGYEISVATTLAENYEWFGEFAALTPDTFILPNFLCESDFPRFLTYLIASRRFDAVLISNSGLGYRLVPYLRSRCPDVALVDYCHMEEEYWNNGGHPRTSVGYQDVLDLTVVASAHLKRWMVARGADPRGIEVSYVNVDPGQFCPDEDVRSEVRDELDIAASTPVILYAGRICAQKQPKVFAMVVEELKARGLDFTCLIAGDGPDRRWLASYIRKHHLTDRALLLGSVSNQRMKELMRAVDILFLPSEMEGIAVVIYEAMATGVVPVGADVGGQDELVTPACGVLVERGTEREEVRAYADALERLIRSSELREAMGHAARERICRHFDIAQMGESMEHLLSRAERERASRRSGILVLPGLAREHTVLAIEYGRLSDAAEGLWKYRGIESRRQRVAHFFERRVAWVRKIVWRANRVFFAIIRPLRRAKDALWIVGHTWKTRLLTGERVE